MNVLRGDRCWKLKYSKSQWGEKPIVHFCPQSFISGNWFQQLRCWSVYQSTKKNDLRGVVKRLPSNTQFLKYGTSTLLPLRAASLSLIPVVCIWSLLAWFWSQRRCYQWKEPPRSKTSKRIPGQKGKALLPHVDRNPTTPLHSRPLSSSFKGCYILLGASI